MVVNAKKHLRFYKCINFTYVIWDVDCVDLNINHKVHEGHEDLIFTIVESKVRLNLKWYYFNHKKLRVLRALRGKDFLCVLI